MKVKGRMLAVIVLLGAMSISAEGSPITTVDANNFPEGSAIPTSVQGVKLSSFTFDPNADSPFQYSGLSIGKAPFDFDFDGAGGPTGYEGFSDQNVFLPSTANLFSLDGTNEGIATGISLTANRMFRQFSVTAFSGTGALNLIAFFFNRDGNQILEEQDSGQFITTTINGIQTNYVRYDYELSQDIRFNTVLFGASDSATFINAVSFSSVPEPATAALLALGLVGLILTRRRSHGASN